MEFGSFKELAWRGVLAESRKLGMVARRLAGCTVTVHFLGTEYAV